MNALLSDNPWAQYGITDPESVAYLKRYPGVASAVPQYGAETARLHFDNFGPQEGKFWGLGEETSGPNADATIGAAAAIPAAAPGGDMYADGQAGWDAYRSQARAATDGINRMPFVYSNYAGIPEDPAVGNALFYGGDAVAQAREEQRKNPLLSGAAVGEASALAPTTATIAGSPSANPLLSGAQVGMAPGLMSAQPGQPVTAAAAAPKDPYENVWVAEQRRQSNDSVPETIYRNLKTGQEHMVPLGPVTTSETAAKYARQQMEAYRAKQAPK